MAKFVFLDIENPNCKNNSICSIGIVVVENNIIIDKIYSLINPEDRFDIRNSDITGIEQSMVQQSPTFKQFWPNISELLNNSIIVGHNVTYDLTVITKALFKCGISLGKLKYFDTLELSQKFINTDSFKLNELAKMLGYTFKAHNALEDALASYEIFKSISMNNELGDPNVFDYEIELNENLDSKLESNINDLYGIIKGISYDNIIKNEEIKLLEKWLKDNEQNKIYSVFAKIINQLTKALEDNIIEDYERIMLLSLVQSIKNSKIYSETTLSLQILQGILKGIVADNLINEKEILNLKTWLKNNEFLSDIYPYDKVYNIVESVLKDGIITNDEFEYLKISFNEILNPYNTVKNIDLANKTYCLTGDFKYGKKSDVSTLLAAKGATEKNGVSSKLDFLFVGSLGSQAWKFGNAGGKIQNAQDLQEKGASIQIIGEEELFKLLKD